MRLIDLFEFQEINFDTKELIASYIGSDKENSELNFTNMFMWKDYYRSRFFIWKNMIVFMHTLPDGEMICNYPCGIGDEKACLIDLKKYFDSLGKPLVITNANKSEGEFFKTVFPDGEVSKNRDFEDYIYTTQSLISFSGKKLHAKKNHLNRFKSKYPQYIYRELGPEDFDRCMEFSSRIMNPMDYTQEISVEGEYMSLKRLFDNFSELGLKGGIIEVDGNIAAFAVGEQYTTTGALIHAEKADVSYDGIYAAINNEFVKNAWSHTEFINREEDMGVEGLRKSKLSYRPVRLVEKYNCFVK